jgi:hypothetical protein
VTGVIQILKAAAGVTAIVGSGDNARIYPLERPQGTAIPAIIVRSLSDEPEDTKDGAATFTNTTIGVYSQASTYGGALALAAAVRTALDRASGTYGGEEIDTIFYQDQDTYKLEIGGGQTGGLSGSNNEIVEIEHIYDVWIRL